MAEHAIAENTSAANDRLTPKSIEVATFPVTSNSIRR